MSDLSTVLLGLNKALVVDSNNTEVALPGNWSPKLFYRDLMQSPVKSEEVLIAEFREVMKRIHEENNYLEFFERTRGYKREIGSEKLWNLFSKSNLMLYFEEVFLEVIEGSVLTETPGENELLIQFLNVLAERPISKWNEIVANAGACCYQWFAKEPLLYIPLLTRKDKSSFENYTDAELFEFLGETLLNFPENNRLSIENCRSDAILLSRSRTGSKQVS